MGHSVGIHHRDLKSANLMVTRQQRIKVIDFGSSIVNIDRRLTGKKKKRASDVGSNDGELAGTLPWTAPELLEGKVFTDKSDVYSFGIILWEIFSDRSKEDGGIPYAGMRTWDIRQYVLNKNRPPIPKNMHPDILHLITRCWSHNPERRPTFATIYTALLKIRTKTKNYTNKF